MNTVDFSVAVERIRTDRYDPNPSKVRFHIPDPKENLQKGFNFFVPDAQYLPKYDLIAEWLDDNKGRGLICMGNLGRGKTVICTKIIPVLLNQYCRLIVNVVDAQELNSSIDNILQRHIICVDDVGTENEYIKYGERRTPFAELVDQAEKKGKLLILTTNLTVSELANKYGERTIDRLRAITKIVLFRGESLRS